MPKSPAPGSLALAGAWKMEGPVGWTCGMGLHPTNPPPRHDDSSSRTTSKGVFPRVPEDDQQGDTHPEQETVIRRQERAEVLHEACLMEEKM